MIDDNDRVATLDKDSNSERYSNHDHDHDHGGGKDQASEFDGDRQGGINCRVGSPHQFFILCMLMFATKLPQFFF